ncbi:MAG: carbohydrate ABC transporter permease [Candidatus Fimadaptatus sp.]|jgi:putative aldouronate transport system permease protein
MVGARRVSKGDWIMQIVINVLMAVMLVLFLYPIWETVVRSLSTPETADHPGLKLWPREFTVDAYKNVLKNPDFLIGFKNSVVRTVLGSLIAVAFTFCGGYALSRRDLPGKGIITFYIVLTMFISAGLIPTYLNIRNLGMFNTIWAWVLPGAVSAWNLTICRNFIGSLPYELEESAMVDGAHPLTIVFRIVLPLSAPILAVLVLWTAVGQWNSWFDAMIYTPDNSMTVLQLVVRRMIVSSTDESNLLAAAKSDVTSTTMKCATIMVSTIPILCVYPFLQKYFVKGVMVGALKG